MQRKDISTHLTARTQQALSYSSARLQQMIQTDDNIGDIVSFIKFVTDSEPLNCELTVLACDATVTSCLHK